MKRTTTKALIIAPLLVAMLGCQSGARLAWWKKETPAPDSSAVARSAGTSQLPSAQSAPPVSVPGLEPATPPSAASLAASGTPATPITPATTPGTDVPIASYTAVDAAADKLTAANGATPAPPAVAAIPPYSAAPTSPTTVAASGPYSAADYKPSTPAASSTEVAQTTTPSVDRYNMGASSYASAPETTPIASPAPSTVESLVAAPVTNTAIPAAPAGDRYGYAATTAVPTQTSDAASVANPFSTAPDTAPLGAVVTAAATGQYRPGGTSTYAGSIPTSHVEIATLPGSPSTTTTPAAPTSTGIPWAPTTTTPTPSSGTQRY